MDRCKLTCHEMSRIRPWQTYFTKYHICLKSTPIIGPTFLQIVWTVRFITSTDLNFKAASGVQQTQQQCIAIVIFYTLLTLCESFIRFGSQLKNILFDEFDFYFSRFRLIPTINRYINCNFILHSLRHVGHKVHRFDLPRVHGTITFFMSPQIWTGWETSFT